MPLRTWMRCSHTFWSRDPQKCLQQTMMLMLGSFFIWYISVRYIFSWKMFYLFCLSSVDCRIRMSALSCILSCDAMQLHAIFLHCLKQCIKARSHTWGTGLLILLECDEKHVAEKDHSQLYNNSLSHSIRYNHSY